MSDRALANHFLTQNDSGRKITVQIGERIRISLPEGATGFRWALVADTNVLRQVDDDVVAELFPRGHAGDRILLFEAVSSGATSLRLQKRRDWDGNVADEFEVAVNVVD
jgi:predicted secreted protein